MSENATELTDKTFNDYVKNNRLVLADLWAPWCGPCRRIAPIVEEIASEYKGKIAVGKLNIDENNETAAQYGVMSIPTLLILNEGKLVDKIIGAQPKENIIAKLKPYIK
ncbi:Thioredoxin [uncultured archaeon]|nr:Thioredoxin [uncultured archaeon]